MNVDSFDGEDVKGCKEQGLQLETDSTNFTTPASSNVFLSHNTLSKPDVTFNS